MTAHVVTCPTPHPTGDPRPTVFLAGGITGCRDWQADTPPLLPDGTVAFNPRRPDWPIDDPAASAGQIAWEFDHLHRADAILVWFSHETIQPITLFELAAHAYTGRRIAVGADPRYPRRTDVVLQLRHARPDITVRDTLQAVCADAVGLLDAAAGVR